MVNGVFYYIPIKSFFSKEFNVQYYICPNCLEVIEDDTCYVCGRRFIINKNEAKLITVVDGQLKSIPLITPQKQ
ncbi:MAG: hypothetical protein GF353_10775 [Candidatus Lokiarchaeota archaeon]|nr:hypothetical protein [Candidatus Lokiarchaeota archaeon]